MSGLPEGWAWTTLGQITRDCDQRVPDTNDEFRYVDIASVDRQSKAITAPQTLLGKEAPSRARKEIRHGDVLVSMTRPNLNAVAMVPEDLDRQIASTGFDVLRASEVDPRWVFNAVRSQDFVERMSSLVQGALYPAVRSKDVRGYELPLAPLPEQKRIADKLDSVLARVDACRDRLDRIPALLKRFRQAVLAAATSGRLTEDWRDGAAASWEEVRLSDIGQFGRGKSKHRPRNDPRLYGGPYPFVQTGDVGGSGGIIRSHSQTYSEFGLAQSKLWPAGTLCITIAANIADTAILSYPSCFPDSVVGFIPDSAKCHALFVKWAIDVMKEDLERFAPATAQKNINLGVLSEVTFNLPPLAEQHEIVRRVETLFAFADRLEARCAAARKQAGQLTPALLAKAFRGELVPQDPADEPAAELLKRLAARRAEAPKARRGRKPVAAGE